jgi:ribosome recycling factor
MDYDEIILTATEGMEKSVEHLKGEYQRARTGRATPALVDSIRVEYYGTPTPMAQLANISIPDPRQIVIKPFDATVLGEIEKAIQKSDLGINPSNDGKVVRLTIPPPSDERRKKTIATLKDQAEQARVAIRNQRRDANKHAEQAKKDGEMTEDDEKRCKDEIQELTKTSEASVTKLFEEKEKEIKQS